MIGKEVLFTHIEHKTFIPTLLSIIILFVILCILLNNQNKRIEYTKENISEYVKKIEKYTNEKNITKLKETLRNEGAINQLLEDFSNDEMIINSIDYYMLTATIVRVELKCKLKDDIKTYLIMIDNKEVEWETSAIGFI